MRFTGQILSYCSKEDNFRQSLDFTFVFVYQLRLMDLRRILPDTKLQIWS
jgi:hypothetical protein